MTMAPNSIQQQYTDENTKKWWKAIFSWRYRYRNGRNICWYLSVKCSNACVSEKKRKKKLVTLHYRFLGQPLETARTYAAGNFFFAIHCLPPLCCHKVDVKFSRWIMFFRRILFTIRKKNIFHLIIITKFIVLRVVSRASFITFNSVSNSIIQMHLSWRKWKRKTWNSRWATRRVTNWQNYL